MSSPATSLFRRLVLAVCGLRWFRWMATRTPPGRLVASRFVAGETLDQAVDVARALDRQRISGMLDHLGENVTAPEHALAAASSYTQALDRIASERSLDLAISIKLTQLGLDLSRELCVAHVNRIADAAETFGTLVMIDMESHGYVDRTLDVLQAVSAGGRRVGICLQAYLLRTERDAFELPTGCRVRLVKGAYLEPPEVVHDDKREVDLAFARLFATLYERGHPLDVATHDPALIEGVKRHVDGDGWSRVEFQMLYGVRRDLQAKLAGEGYPVRVYVPYGTEWYPYLTRRLAERPANLWFFLSSLARSARS